jgi:hypothetical protein
MLILIIIIIIIAEFSIRMKLLQVVTIIILILSSTAHDDHTVTLSMDTQFSQIDSYALSNQNSTECPSVWFEYNQATHDCQCRAPTFWNCEGDNVYTDTHSILTYDSTRGVISAVKIRHKYLEGYNLTVTKDGSSGILLPNNISDLNPYMCGPLNREDYLCNKCKSGYGPATCDSRVSILCRCVLFVRRYVDSEKPFALSCYQFHSSYSVLSHHSCISNQANFRTYVMLHHVQSVSDFGILRRMWS